MSEQLIFSDTFAAMGNHCDVVLPGLDAEEAKTVFQQVKSRVEAIEMVTSVFQPFSEVHQINQTKVDEWVEVSETFWDILQLSSQFYQLSNGAFDVTVAPLHRLWSENTNPDEKQMAEAKAQSGFDKVEMDEENRRIRFIAEGVELDFGLLEQAYALEQVKPVLEQEGIHNAIVSFSEKVVLALGNHPSGEPWPIGIRNARNVHQFVYLFPASNEFVVNLGTRFVRDDDQGTQTRTIISPADATAVTDECIVAVKSVSPVMGTFVALCWMVLPENDREIVAGQLENIEIFRADYLEDDIRTKAEILGKKA